MKCLMVVIAPGKSLLFALITEFTTSSLIFLRKTQDIFQVSENHYPTYNES